MNRKSIIQSPFRTVLWLLLALLLSACSSLETTEQKQEGRLGSQQDPGQPQLPSSAGVDASATALSDRFPAAAKGGDGEKAAAAEPARIFRGTGKFVKATPARRVPQTPEKGDVTLNFENTDIREIVKVILGDLLQVNYVMDPGVRGGVTMQTGRPLKREDLLPTLETLLRMSGSAMVETAGTYRIAPAAKALQGTATPQLAGTSTPLPTGYNILIVPLQYISVGEMSKILQPLVVEGSIVRADERRNLLVLAGTGRELDNMLDTIHTFDVDWLQGMSVGFFELQYAEVADVERDLDAILSSSGDDGLSSLIKVVPIESTNGMLVITKRAEYLDKIARWIKRMDILGSKGGSEERLFVYRVKNGEAEKIAEMLNELYSSKKSERPRSASVAPGLVPKKIESAATKPGEVKSPAKAAVVKAGAGTAGLETEVRIVADTDNNSLLIMTTPRDYEKILNVLKELDIIPLQVHIEATIVEVTLNETLEYGIQWFFKNHIGNNIGEGHIDGQTLSPLNTLFRGFTWNLVDSANNVRAVLNAFAGDTDVNVLSAPSVMVLDNHTAKIQVGDDVPIVTEQRQGEETTSSVVNSVQYRSTGVILTVKPRVNPGGLVTMEIEQDVSNAVQATAGAGPNSPTIQTRKITSTVAVQSGQAVVLGGLIETEESKNKSGVPGLYNLPLIGALFGETSTTNDRKELVVILTPSVIANNLDARKITEDFRAKLQGLKGSF